MVFQGRVWTFWPPMPGSFRIIADLRELRRKPTKAFCFSARPPMRIVKALQKLYPILSQTACEEAARQKGNRRSTSRNNPLFQDIKSIQTMENDKH